MLLGRIYELPVGLAPHLWCLMILWRDWTDLKAVLQKTMMMDSTQSIELVEPKDIEEVVGHQEDEPLGESGYENMDLEWLMGPGQFRKNRPKKKRSGTSTRVEWPTGTNKSYSLK